MSLNTVEQQVFDYVQKNPEEKNFWEQKVRAIMAAGGPDGEFAARMALDAELRAYLAERASVTRALAGLPAGVSMRNLAEHWIRMWTPPRPRKKHSAADFPG